jgi:PAS domain-containing protein
MRKVGIGILLFGLGLCGPARAQLAFRTPRFLAGIDSRARLIRLVDLKTRADYAPEGHPGYLVRLRNAEGEELAPAGVRAQEDLLIFVFDGGIELQVRVARKADYLRFELVRVAHPEKVDAVLWGPIRTTIDETIGEVVGVVRNRDFAIGIQTLNAKTCGGKLVNEEGTTGGTTTAAKEDFGSSLQAFCVNQGRDRVMTVWNQYKNVPVKALPGFTLEGSALTLFGTAPDDALALIGRIEIAEGLPHPTIDGQWIKASGAAGRPYLIANFSEKTFDEMLEYTRRLGFYSLYHSGPFKTWGHFDLLEDEFPDGWAGMKRCVDKARAMGIRVGSHTLTNFITTNDPFVTTAANRGLMAAGVALLEKDVDAAATEIAVDRADYFEPASTLNSVLIGSEIIRYQRVAGNGPYILRNCVRGAFGTAAAAHARGAEARKLMDHPYRTLFPDWPMQEELIRNLAAYFNATGVSHMDFDGHEGTCYLGRGEYGHDHFVEAFLAQVDHPVINGSSNMDHFYWHMNSYINWGEPWYASFRESQAEYRFRHQAFFERNYMPHMLGWFLLTPDTRLEDVEWMLARAAGYRAGYAFVADPESLAKNPDTEAIVAAIRTWEEAKELGIFSDEERARLKDPERDFSLERTGENRWALQSYEKFAFEHARKIRQPGEPTRSVWSFENARDAQPLLLFLRLAGGTDVEAGGIELEVDRFFKVTVRAALKKGQSLVWDGSGRMILYDDKGRKIESVALGRSLPLLEKGSHTLAIDARLAGDGPLLKGTVKLKGAVETIVR